jgi:hypothetical protein
MRRNSIAAVLMTATVTLAAGEARAQYWLSDRVLAEGRGIRVGNFELHPGLGSEFGYDSNAFYAGGSTPVDPALRLRVTGNFAISTLGARRRQMPGEENPAAPPVQFRANVGVSYSHFFPVVPATVRSVSDASNLGLNAGLAVTVASSRTWGFTFSNDFARAVQGTSELNFGQLFVFNRWQNIAQIGFTVTPGGGSFEFKGSYTNRLYIFFEPGFEGYSNMGNDINLAMRWRFLPKTAFAWLGTFSPTFYFNPSPIGSGLFTGTPVTTRFGLTGLFTDRLSFQIFGGYGATYFDRGDNVETFIGNAEVRYLTGPSMSVRGGFVRDFGGSFIGNYLIRNNLYLNVSHSFAGRFLLSAEAQAGLIQIGYPTDRTGARSSFLTGTAIGADGRITGFRALAMVFGEYRFSEYFGLNGTLSYTGNFIDAQLLSMGMPGGSLNWNKFEAFLGLRVNW